MSGCHIALRLNFPGSVTILCRILEEPVLGKVNIGIVFKSNSYTSNSYKNMSPYNTVFIMCNKKKNNQCHMYLKTGFIIESVD